MRTLASLRWHRSWLAHLGCLKGCLDYLGASVPFSWICGATGQAFVANVHPALCPSGPTAWNPAPLLALARNLGLRAEGISVWRRAAGDEFSQRQREAFDLVRAKIDAGLPCYGWQLEVPEYYVIVGYDDVGYYYSGPDYYSGQELGDGRGPLPWDRLATWGVDCLEVRSVEIAKPASDKETVRDALGMALRHAEAPAEWVHSPYRTGPAAFDLWADALDSGDASRNGSAYNAVFAHECRSLAVEFLAEAARRLPDQRVLLDEARAHFATSRDGLASLLDLRPFCPDGDGDRWATERNPAGAAIVREVAAAELAGLVALRDAVAEIGGD